MTFISFLPNYKFVIVSCKIFGFLNFHVSHLNHETFKLCLQNTLNMSKTTRVYFRVLNSMSVEKAASPPSLEALMADSTLFEESLLKDPKEEVIAGLASMYGQAVTKKV